MVIMIRTLTWKWIENDRKEYKFLIPDYFYVKGGNKRLLIPQHWYHILNDVKPTQGNGSKKYA